jgi:hypothetical protein
MPCNRVLPGFEANRRLGWSERQDAATSSARHAAARKLNHPLLTSYYFISLNPGAGHAWRTPAPVTHCGPDLFQAAPAADNSFSNLVIQLDIFMIPFLQIAMERG